MYIRSVFFISILARSLHVPEHGVDSLLKFGAAGLVDAAGIYPYKLQAIALCSLAAVHDLSPASSVLLVGLLLGCLEGMRKFRPLKTPPI